MEALNILKCFVARLLPHTDPIEPGWILPFPGSDRSVIEKSQKLFSENDGLRPAQASMYFVAQTTWFFLGIIIATMVLLVLAQIEYGRRLLQEV